MRLALIPRTTAFYALFADAGKNAVEAARLVERRVREYPDTGVDQSEVKRLEHEGDRLTNEIVQLLNTQYVTPFDREDIYSLATTLDDVIDHMDEASDLLDLYQIEASMEQAAAQARVLVQAVEHLSEALTHLQHLRDAEPHLVEVKRLEDEGDRVLRDALGALFENDRIDARNIIRWKDIFEALEESIDACETAANQLGNILVKNA